MTARTHDLVAFTPLVYLIATQPLHKITLATAAFAFGANLLGATFPDLEYAKSFLLIDMTVVWICFMVGYLSHLIVDTATKEGVPWFFLFPWKVGIPPIKAFRITAGEFAEKGLIFPGLLILNGYLIYQNYGKFLDFFSHYITR